MARSSRFRSSALGFLGVVAALAVAWALAGSSGDADAAPKSAPGAGQTRYLLRLADLPPGFAVLPIGAIGVEGGLPGPDVPCGPLDPAEPKPRLAAFIRRYLPSGCFAAYLRLYRAPVPGPYPFLAGTGVIDVGDVEGARKGFALAPQILSHFLFDDEVPASLPSPTAIGEETMLVPWEGARLFRDDEAGTYVVWRSGSVVGVVLTMGRSQVATERDALALARLQQAHVESPTPYAASERDSSEVALDDPRLSGPVFWLGPRLAPPRFPKLHLRASASRPGGGPGRQRVDLAYVYGVDRKGWTQVDLSVVGRQRWVRQGSGRHEIGAIPSPHCARKREVELPRGRAVIYGSFDFAARKCPAGPPRTFGARVFIGDSVITANVLKVCEDCIGSGGGPYNSFAGMEAVVRGLEPRPKRVF